MIKEQEEEYIRLLDVLILISQAAAGTEAGIDDRNLKAEGIFKKFFSHVASALYLYKSTSLELKNFRISFFDSPSINVLGRTALEAFLVFNSIFVLPRTDDEKNFRLYAWLIADVHYSLSIYSRLPSLAAFQVIEKEILATYISKIKSTSFWSKLKEEERINLIEGKGRYKVSDFWRIEFTENGKTRIISWKNLARKSGLNKELSEISYQMLTGYAHSGSSSIISINNARDAESQKLLCKPALNLIMIVMAFMIHAYSKVFHKSKECFEGLDDDTIHMINKWYVGGKDKDANI